LAPAAAVASGVLRPYSSKLRLGVLIMYSKANIWHHNRRKLGQSMLHLVDSQRAMKHDVVGRGCCNGSSKHIRQPSSTETIVRVRVLRPSSSQLTYWRLYLLLLLFIVSLLLLISLPSQLNPRPMNRSRSSTNQQAQSCGWYPHNSSDHSSNRRPQSCCNTTSNPRPGGT